MLNKSTTLKNYLGDIGTKNQVFFMFGNTPSTLTSNTSDSAIDIWKHSELFYRVAKKDSVAVIPNYTWGAGNLYNHWTTKSSNTNPYYAWNKSNGIVYLCISNNNLNRQELSMSNISTQLPSHTYGLQTYSDGYTWLPVYKITADLLRFVNNSWIPVISFDDYRDNEISKYSAADRFCNSSQSSTVICGVYFKNTTKIETSYGSFTTYNAGDLYLSSKTKCQECYYLFENDDRFISVPYSNTAIPSSITVKDNYDKIEELVNTNQISKSSPYYHLYDISSRGLMDGAIVSALVELSSFSNEDLVVHKANPEITITSATGSGASIIFTTYLNSAGENIINGISVVSNGSGYKELSLSIDYTLFPYMSTTQVDALLSSVEVNLDILDGLNFDPISALGAQNIMFDMRIETNVLKQQDIKIPSTINSYAIVENPIEILDDGLEIPAGSQYGKDDSYVETNITRLDTLNSTEPTISTGGQLLVSVNMSDVSGKTSSLPNISIVNSKESFRYNEDMDVEVYYEISIVGTEQAVAADISSITIDDTVYPISKVHLPPIKQYSGKTSQTKKLDTPLILGNSETSTENTKIFRINIVKGF